MTKMPISVSQFERELDYLSFFPVYGLGDRFRFLFRNLTMELVVRKKPSVVTVVTVDILIPQSE